jgi:DNA-binding LytR/AlgR family response regulator
VKPVTLDRLARAVERARARLAGADRREPTTQALRRVAARLPAPAKPRLLVRSGRGHRLLPLADVRSFCAKDGLVYAYSAEGRHLTDYTLAELEERTAGYVVRVSRSALVHVEHVDGIVSNGDGSATLTLSDGTPVRVSRRRAADVRRALEE